MFYALLVKNVIKMMMNITLLVYNVNHDDDDDGYDDDGYDDGYDEP